ncbi:MAG: 23S rRNA (adenine(2503)-C(2))-methyltransferase RlmN [Bacteroidales bacterium]|nr:23S rRNA (adenine(2503)-C(2))-methyltransferase RlmN [Bacteroidales bacterium]
MEKFQILGKYPDELRTWLQAQGLPGYATKQLHEWIYVKRVRDFEKMTNLSKANRMLLAERADLGFSEPVHTSCSVDGTVKYLFRTHQGHLIESVYIPEDDRATLCVSSQVGCKMNCGFCMTGRMGFQAQLTAQEILNQILSITESESLTNIVFMGMGEPMDNMDEVMRALEVLTSEDAFAWSPKRITVSSIGVHPGLLRFLEESKCHLAISLHTPISSQRLSWMPSEKAWPIEETIKILRNHDFGKQRRLSFEYILFKGLNDTPAHAKSLIALLRGLECRVNLIRFHTIPDSPFKSPDEMTVHAFSGYLNAKGLKTTVRKSRGEDIQAACGLLSTKKGGQ